MEIQGLHFGTDPNVYETEPDRRLNHITREFTIEAWIYADSLPWGGTLVDKTTPDKHDGFALAITKSGWLRMQTTDEAFFLSHDEVPADKWIHIVGIFSQSQALYQLHINGKISININDANIPMIRNNPQPLRIGCNSNGQARFNGRIHRLSIFSRALNQSEISQLNNAPFPAHELKDCIVSWNLSHDTEDRLYSRDASRLRLVHYGSTERLYYPQIESIDHRIHTTDAQRSLYSERPAWHWHETLNTGNGTQGLMVWGNPHDEQIICTHEKLFQPRHPLDIEPPSMAHVMDRVKKLCLEGKFKQAYALSVQGARDKGWDRHWPPDSFHPALAIRLQQSFADKVTAYQRSLDMLTGEITVRWTDAGGRFMRQAFVSRSHNIFVIRLSSPDNKPIQCRLWLKDMGIINGRPYAHQPADIQLSRQWLTYRSQYSDFACTRGYEAVLRIINPRGIQTLDRDKIKVMGAREVLIIGAINDLDDTRFTALNTIQAFIQKRGLDYDNMLATHIKAHRRIMDRVIIDLDANIHRHRLSTEQLIAEQQAKPHRIDPVLLEKLFYLGRFSFIASAGFWPPALSGIWSGHWQTRDSDTFNLNGNLNLQITQANIGNIPEGMDAYTNLITSLVPDWRKNARAIFDANGIVSNNLTGGRCGIQFHFQFPAPNPFWTAGAPWLMNPMYEYYLVSGDEDYLKDTLFPIMKESALFYEDFLTETDKQGHVIFVPSLSPGIKQDSHNTPVGINAALDLAAAREIFTNLIHICQTHHWETDNLPRWQTLLHKIPPYRINNDGAIAEWSWPQMPDTYDQGHGIPLYGVFPAHEIDPDKNAKLFTAAQKAASKRIAHRPRASAGDGIANLGLIGARLKDAPMVKTILTSLMTEGYLLPTLFTIRDRHTNAYNLDVLHILPAIIMEALVYSRPGLVEILPALPTGLRKGSINGILCRGQVRVDHLAWDLNKGQATVTLTSQMDQDIQLIMRHGFRDIESQDTHVKRINRQQAEMPLKKDVAATINVWMGG